MMDQSNFSNQEGAGKQRISLPNIDLPKGGGAIKGMGESFQPNGFSGTSSYTVPIYTASARGFEPSLALSYNSGSGNSIFGIGFSVGVPAIVVRTDKGIPKYDGTNIFLFGGEELVPKLEQDAAGVNQKIERTVVEDGIEWQVTSYLPRVETAYAKIEQWLDPATNLSHWRTTSKENVQTIYGKAATCRIADPAAPRKIFSWLVQREIDPKGNKINYRYLSENKENIGTQLYQRGHQYTANKYLKSIQYGNYIDGQGSEQFAFEVVFDYGEHDLSQLETGMTNPYLTNKKWAYRPDPFSSFRSGFEIRTCRRCLNILTFQRFEHLYDGAPFLVYQTKINYKEGLTNKIDQSKTVSSIESIQGIGYKRQEDGSYEAKSLPPLNFEFSSFDPPERPIFKQLKVEAETIPGRLDQVQFLPVDLYGEGIPGFLYSNAAATTYYEAEGAGAYKQASSPSPFPIDKNLQDGAVTFADLDGNGRLDLVANNQEKTGFYENIAGAWQNFQAFEHYPTIAQESGMESAGLAANGKMDLLIVKSDNIQVFPSAGKAGYLAGTYKIKGVDFPLQKQNDKEVLVTFSDMFGDGLPHRVQIKNGQVDCWPCLGYGNFGEKISFENAPLFEDSLNVERLFLADVDGSGMMDLVYVFSDHIALYLNQSGNSFSEAIRIDLPEQYSPIDQISFADIYGNGTSCLIFTKIEAVPRHYFVEFVGAIEAGETTKTSMKPYLLNQVDNNLGAITIFQYASSTKFYLEDKYQGRPWVTRLFFPVQVVEKITSIDLIAGTRFTSSFKYHDGYFDPIERTFRGFGFVESWDTETYEDWVENNAALTFPTAEVKRELYVPPVYTKTWYHTGAFMETGMISKQYQQEYFQGDANAYDFPDSVFSASISQSDIETYRQAYVALKGLVMRQEVYGEDGQAEAQNPYTVEESNVEVVLLQAAAGQRYAVFQVNPRESITYQYERNPADPRVQQTFILAVDPLSGEVQKSCLVYLPRRTNANGVGNNYPEQEVLKATADLTSYIDTLDTEVYRWRGIPCEAQQLEIFGLDLQGADYFNYPSILTQVNQALDKVVTYEGELSDDQPEARQLTWRKTYFWDETQDVALGLQEISSRGLIHHEEQAVFTTAYLDKITDRNLSATLLNERGGYYLDPANNYWWNRGLVQKYYLPTQPERFFQPDTTLNAYVAPSSSLFVKTVLGYDEPYYLRPIKNTQYLNETEKGKQEEVGELDYISLALKQLIDRNQNVTQVIYDPLGAVMVSSQFGTEDGNAVGGMRLYPYEGQPAEYVLRTTAQAGGEISFQDILDHSVYYLQGAASFFYYNLTAWEKRQPVSTINLIRNNFYLAPVSAEVNYCQTQISYRNGTGNLIEEKQKVDAGLAIATDKVAQSIDKINAEELLVPTEHRWLVSGRTVYNNKTKPAEEYLSYFSTTPDYETQEEVTNQLLVPPPSLIHYDALAREIRRDTPKGFFTKVSFSPWEEKAYDEDDTILDAPYYISFMENYPADPTQAQQDEKDALDKAAKFYDTPTTTIADNMGSVILVIQDNLGAVATNTFEKILNNTFLKSSDLWADLVRQGYLSTEGRLTSKYSPYTPSFSLNLSSEFKDYEASVTHLLLEGVLVAYYATDIESRVVLSIDPRLYYKNIVEGKEYYNFKYYYEMGGETPFSTDSVDAGKNDFFNNIYGNLFWSWSARRYNQLLDYDRLQRKTVLWVKQIPLNAGEADLEDYRLVEEFIYGETQTNPSNFNLVGEVYQVNDLSGTVLNKKYNIQGKLQETTRQMCKEYKLPIDWSEAVVLEPEVFVFEYEFDALGRKLFEKTPDESKVLYDYNERGLLDKVSLTFSNGTKQDVIDTIEYDAQGQRERIQYANGTKTSYRYENTTLNLLQLLTTRPNKNAQGQTQNTQLQNILYTYDPVGNLTRMRDESRDVVFNNNEKVVPLSDYTYDALYRLLKANGRQHPGITKNTYKNNSAAGDFKQSKFSPSPSDYTKLEQYEGSYTYDASGNLTQIQHKAKSANWTRQMPVAENSNRLTGLEYDACGNQRQLQINNTVALAFNCCENLVNAIKIERPEELDDSDYYNYDSEEMRTRKVSERMANGGTVSTIEEKIYLKNYETKRLKSTNAAGGATTTLDRQTLRIMDDQRCVLIVHYWKQDDQGKEVPAADTRSLRWQLDNQLESVSLELDTDAQVISYEEYFPYGGTAIIAGRNEQEVKLKDYRYSGKECDDSTGLYYYGARYYASWLGRWLKPDPAGTVDGMNLFAFVGGNPIRYMDPSGYMKRTHQETQDAFPSTPGIWGRTIKKKDRAVLTPKRHLDLGIESYEGGETQGKRRRGEKGGYIYLFRVEDKGSIPTKKGQVYTTPGNPWTPQRSVAWVKGGISSGASFVLTTDPTDSSVYTQSKGKHKGELSIYGREVSELLAHNYIPILESREDVLKKSKKTTYSDDDQLVVMVPGRQTTTDLATDWSRVSSTEVPDFTSDFYYGLDTEVTPEDIAYQFQSFADFVGEDNPLKLYGKAHGSSSSSNGKK
ncbi:MAG: SpvB/TcaC N-terminal domain-containing protein [Saprospiraceae bacterium]